MPDDLLPAYSRALAQLPSLVAQAASREWDGELLASALSAIAAAKGWAAVAEAALEVTPEIAPEFLDWLSER